MAKTTLRQTAPSLFVNDEKNGLIEVSKIAVPHTTITNRAKIIDLANDMSCHFGINRIQTQDIYRIQNEFGPSGQSVYGVVNDKFDQIRLVGSGWSTINTSGGVSSQNNVQNDYMEVTFYGTGLNILGDAQQSTRDLRITVDGGAEGSNIHPNGSSIISGRNYTPNSILGGVDGLSLGIHTVKIRNNTPTASNVWISGFEILSESSNIEVAAGTTYINDFKIDVAQQSIAYDSGFTNEYGTPGTRGGHAIVYVDESGIVKKDIQYTNASQANLTSADHSNEEVIRTYNFREFGTGRTDDFSMSDTGTADRAFTLDDGTTTLIGNEVADDPLNPNAVGAFITFVFVGTGLDFSVDAAAGTANPHDIYIDGNIIGAYDTSFQKGKYKIVSGLPYGTHTLKIQRTGNGTRGLGIRDLIVYGPKKPELPADSVELGSYYLMADYSLKVQSGTGDQKSSGVLTKSNVRELVYNGTWSGVTLRPDLFETGHYITTTTATSYVEFTFFGTGFEYTAHLLNGQTYDLDFTWDGNSDFTSFTNQKVSWSGISFTAATGKLSGTAGGQSGVLSVSDMPLGLHTIRLTTNNAANFWSGTFTAITPVHSPKNNGPFVIQNTATVGSTALSDSRNIIDISERSAVVRGESIAGVADITSSTDVPLQYANITFLSDGGDVEIKCDIMARHQSANFRTNFSLYVDGEQIIDDKAGISSSVGAFHMVNLGTILRLSKGAHNIQIFANNGGSGTVNGISYILLAKQL